MVRLPIPPERIAADLWLSPAERHYLCDVLRLEGGATVEVFDGLGGRFSARLDAARTHLSLGERLPDLDDGGGGPVALAPALIKNDRLDWAIEKATELGAARIEPWSAANCVVRLDARRSVERQARWQKVAAAAARQCGRAAIPEVAAPRALEALLQDATRRGELAVVLFERELDCRFSELVRALDPAQPLLIVSGPEGGFREEEIALARALGARTASLGRRILRAETAPIAALAAVRALHGEL